jgi:cell division initiation protein
MIDLTPLDVRKKAGDFKKVMRGYDPKEVEDFLQLAAGRLEELVKENLTLKERSERLMQQVSAHETRERAVQEALVMAQKLREDLRVQAEGEAELSRQRAAAEAQNIAHQVERSLDDARRALAELERRRLRFLKAFRSLLERELEAVEVEEGRAPEVLSLDADLDAPAGFGRAPAPTPAAEGSEPPANAPTWLASVAAKPEAVRSEREEEPPV